MGWLLLAFIIVTLEVLLKLIDLIKSIKIGYLPVLRQTPLQPDINEVLGSDHPQGCKGPTLIPAKSQVMQNLGA